MANPKLFINKDSSVCYACIGDVVTYTIYSTNIGDITLNDVTIMDLLSPNLQFIPNSVTINGEKKTNLNITSGINLGSLELEKTKAITFDAKVISEESTTIENTALGEFTYSVDPSLPPRSGESKSNSSILYAKKVSINIKKESNKKNVVLGDKVTYTVTLSNNGDIDANSVFFFDKLPPELKLIDGSFTLNNTVINGVDLSQGINVGTIKSASSVTLKFDVIVTSGNCKGVIINNGHVKFNYMLPDGSSGIKTSVSDETSSNILNVALTTFKQISIDEYLSIPDVNPDIEEINSINAEIEIKNCHVIETPKVTSIEGQILTGYKLIIHGMLKQIIQYTTSEPEQSVHSAHYNIPFSNFIILPKNYNLGCKLDISGDIEDIYYDVINPRCFFKSVSLLLKVKVLD